MGSPGARDVMRPLQMIDGGDQAATAVAIVIMARIQRASYAKNSSSSLSKGRTDTVAVRRRYAPDGDAAELAHGSEAKRDHLALVAAGRRNSHSEPAVHLAPTKNLPFFATTIFSVFELGASFTSSSGGAHSRCLVAVFYCVPRAHAREAKKPKAT